LDTGSTLLLVVVLLPLVQLIPSATYQCDNAGYIA
jgi:hypothetical protein